MRQMALDHISIPGMSAETKQVFSDTKLFISDLHSRLGLEIIEALECIRKWILTGRALGGDGEGKNGRHFS